MKKYLLIALACFALAMPQTMKAQDETPDYSNCILTPKAPLTPRINGPKVYGARPGAEFLFRIPTTGKRPMQSLNYSMKNVQQYQTTTGIIISVISTSMRCR